MIETSLMPQINVVDPITCNINITIQTVISDNEREIGRRIDEKNFQKGQIADVKSFLGVDSSPEITYIESIWSR